MKKKSVALSSFLTMSVLGMASTSFAAVDPTEVTGTEDGKGATSHGYIKLTPGDETTGPTDPIDPSEPGGETGNKGPLTIDNVSPLLFGEHELVGSESVYTTETKNPNAQVTDKRGKAEGWTLQVVSSEFVDQANEKNILKGALLVLPAGKAVSSLGNISTAPTTRGVALSTNNGTAETLMQAEKESGMGTWVDKFDSSEVKLVVPAGNKTGEYVSTLTWSLLDAPQ